MVVVFVVVDEVEAGRGGEVTRIVAAQRRLAGLFGGVVLR